MLLNFIPPVLAKAQTDISTFSWDYQDLDGLGIRLAINLMVLYIIIR